jgi:hypothetical protein
VKAALTILLVACVPIAATQDRDGRHRWREPQLPVPLEVVLYSERCTNRMEAHSAFVSFDGGSYGLIATDGVDGCTATVRDIYDEHGGQELVASEHHQLKCGAKSPDGYQCHCIASDDVPRLRFEWAVCNLNIDRAYAVQSAFLALTQNSYMCTNDAIGHLTRDLDRYDDTAAQQLEIIQATTLSPAAQRMSVEEIRNELRPKLAEFAQRFDGGFSDLRETIRQCPQQAALKRLEELGTRGFVER